MAASQAGRQAQGGKTVANLVAQQQIQQQLLKQQQQAIKQVVQHHQVTAKVASPSVKVTTATFAQVRPHLIKCLKDVLMILFPSLSDVTVAFAFTQFVLTQICYMWHYCYSHDFLFYNCSHMLLRSRSHPPLSWDLEQQRSQLPSASCKPNQKWVSGTCCVAAFFKIFSSIDLLG